LGEAGVTRSQLKDGLRVLSEPIQGATSVSLGFWIRAGSRDERREHAGITHLMEHMLFKGVPGMDASGIAKAFESMGAQENAATGEEYTVLHARFLPEHLEKALDLMSAMISTPTLEDLEREREVIVEEIRMYEDHPEDVAEEELSSLIFHADPLGRPIIGSAQSVRGVDYDTLSAFHGAIYHSGNVFVVGSGNLDPDEFEGMVREKLGGRLPEGKPFERNSSPAVPDSRFLYRHKDTGQYHVALGGPGIPAWSQDRFAMAALNTLLGGGMGSRLFQEVREKRGLAYAVLSFHEGFSDAGAIKVYVGSTTENVREAVEVIRQELEKLRREPVTEEELYRAKEQLKSATILSLESIPARMRRIGSSVITGSELLSPDEISDRIERITAGDIQRLAEEHLDPQSLYLAAVGPEDLELGEILS